MSNKLKVDTSFRNISSRNPLDSLKIGMKNNPAISNSEGIENLYPNIPFKFLYEKNKRETSICNAFQRRDDITYNSKNDMNIFGISLNNEHWQDYASKFGTLYLYNAYFDNRKSDTLGSKVRITAMAQRRLTRNDTYYCLYWFNASTNPIISNTPVSYTHLTLPTKA